MIKALTFFAYVISALLGITILWYVTTFILNWWMPYDEARRLSSAFFMFGGAYFLYLTNAFNFEPRRMCGWAAVTLNLSCMLQEMIGKPEYDYMIVPCLIIGSIFAVGWAIVKTLEDGWEKK